MRSQHYERSRSRLSVSAKNLTSCLSNPILAKSKIRFHFDRVNSRLPLVLLAIGMNVRVTNETVVEEKPNRATRAHVVFWGNDPGRMRLNTGVSKHVLNRSGRNLGGYSP